MTSNGSFCLDCGTNTSEIHEYYMLRDEVWNEAVERFSDPQWAFAHHGRGPATMVPFTGGMLCIGCVEFWLRRSLVRADFDFDWMDQFQGLRSVRLMARLAHE